MRELTVGVDNPKQLRIAITRALDGNNNEVYVRAIAKFKWQFFYLEHGLDSEMEAEEEITRIFKAVETVYPDLDTQIEETIDDELNYIMAMEEVFPNRTNQPFG